MGRTFEPTDRTRVRRRSQRGVYDRDVVDAILDEALICHVGFVGADGQPVVIPTIHARVDDTLYLHGSAASALLAAGAAGASLCITVTLIDALVLARSAFHHSMNYRSVVVFGAGREVTDTDEKMRAAEAVVEHVAKGRWAECRWPTPSEMRATKIVAVALDEASAKVRTGDAIDDDEDLSLDAWAGLLPLTVAPGEPVPDPLLSEDAQVPPSVTGWRRPG